MESAKHLLLSEYIPKSELIVESHDIQFPKFPVIDIHSHFGSLLWEKIMKADMIQEKQLRTLKCME